MRLSKLEREFLKKPQPTFDEWVKGKGQPLLPETVHVIHEIRMMVKGSWRMVDGNRPSRNMVRGQANRPAEVRSPYLHARGQLLGAAPGPARPAGHVAHDRRPV
jgi:hypothetical protein